MANRVERALDERSPRVVAIVGRRRRRSTRCNFHFRIGLGFGALDFGEQCFGSGELFTTKCESQKCVAIAHAVEPTWKREARRAEACPQRIAQADMKRSTAEKTKSWCYDVGLGPFS